MSDVTVVYIICPGHSGSTLLDLLLASHSHMVTVGEAKMLSPSRRMPVSARRCTCGARDLHTCELWSRVESRMRQVFGLDIDDLDLESPEPQLFARHNLALFESVAAVTGRSVIVDSSKSPVRLERLLTLKAIEVRPIQLRRAAPGVVYSNVKKGRPWAHHALAYARHYARSERILANRPVHRLRYESLASEPRETLTSLMRWLGQEFEENQLGWRGRQHHSVAGNHMRFRSDAIRLDETWKSGLSAFQKVGTNLLTGPAAVHAAALVEALAGRWQRIRRLGRPGQAKA